MNSPFRIKKSAILSPVASPTLTLQGEMAYDSAADVIKVRNSASTDSLAQIAAIQTLTNKTMDGGDNTFSNIDYASLVLSNSIVNADIAAAAAIDFSKLANLTAGNILVGNGSNVATSVAMSGEATISNAGVVTLDNAAVIGKVLTGFVAGAGVVSATDTVLQAFQKIAGSFSGTNTGDISLTTVGVAPNANGASLSGQVLTLQPADNMNPGVITASAQEIGGAKTFNNNLIVNNALTFTQDINSALTGSAAILTAPSKAAIVVTNASLVSITGITDPSIPQIFILTNNTGATVTILNDIGTASQRIITGTGADIPMAANASLFLYRDTTASRWRVIGGSGGGSKLVTASKTANYTATANDDVLLCDATGGSFTISLPAASTLPGKTYHVKKTDSSVSTITLDGNSSELIDGLLTQVIATQYQTISIVSNGSNWSII